MNEAAAFQTFGSFLRELRTRCGLTLRAVAAASQSIPREAGDPISPTYLALLESGRPTNVALPKLLSLAAIYQASVQQLLSRAPTTLQRKLRPQWRKWLSERPVVVDPPPPPPGLRRDDLYEQLDPILAATARSVTMPFDDETGWRRSIRELLLSSASPPLLLAGGSRLCKAFWSHHADQVKALRLDESNSERAWKRVGHLLADWLVARPDVETRLRSTLDWWTADYADGVASCHFQTAEDERRFGYDRAPIALVSRLRSIEAAELLSGHMPAALHLPPTPARLDALRTYLRSLLDRESVPWHGGEVGSLPFALDLASELTARLPQLRPDPHHTTSGVRESIIRLTEAAAVSSGPPAHRRQPRGRKQA